MKKFIALTTCLLTAVFLFAQPQKQQDNRRQKEWERLQSEKIAFITAELDLTPEEAQVFWPVYNQCWKEVHAANKAMREAFSEFRGKKGDELSDKDLEKQKVSPTFTALDGKLFLAASTTASLEKLVALYRDGKGQLGGARQAAPGALRLA